MQQADKFVILSHCQFEKNGFQNRFNIDKKWKTMSVYRGLESIINKTYVNPEQDWKKIKNSLVEYEKELNLFDDFIGESLLQTNSLIIKKIAERLNIKTEIVFDYETDLKGTERLVDLCKHYGATKYISGVSGKKYLNLELFEKENIDVEYQEEKDMIKKSSIEVIKDA
jgi:hypothetical protein